MDELFALEVEVCSAQSLELDLENNKVHTRTDRQTGEQANKQTDRQH